MNPANAAAAAAADDDDDVVDNTAPNHQSVTALAVYLNSKNRLAVLSEKTHRHTIY